MFRADCSKPEASFFLNEFSASIEQRLLETIREQQEGRRDHERAYRKAREAEEKLAQERSEWSAQRSRLVFVVRTLQSALSVSFSSAVSNSSPFADLAERPAQFAQRSVSCSDRAAEDENPGR